MSEPQATNTKAIPDPHGRGECQMMSGTSLAHGLWHNFQ